MKRTILTVISVILITSFSGCMSKNSKKSVVIPAGYDGIYVVKVNEGDKSVLPLNITGLVLKRNGSSYDIILSNIDEKAKTAEEIEDLEYTWADGQFDIKFGSSMKLKPVSGGLDGTLDFNGKPAKLYLKKIK